MAIKVFIDGREGTTGLKIEERLSGRNDIVLLEIDEKLRKNKAERKRLINMSDVTFLCLPDDAARESVSLCENENTIIIDASTAHRTSPEFTYGFPELSDMQREKIRKSKRIAVPGCHASGFIALVYPLVKEGIISPDYPITCHSVTGYSGGGKKMIAEYEDAERDEGLDSPRQYALTQNHKHLPEMTKICGLTYEPHFSPIVSDYFSGMVVTVPLFARLLNKKMTCKELFLFYREYYKNQKFLSVDEDESSFINANYLSGSNKMQILVKGNNERILLISRFDNLGKGASGAAVQCMNIALGLDEGLGL